MSDFRKPRPDYPLVPREALYRTERPTFFKRPKGRRGRKPKGKKSGQFVASQAPNFAIAKKADDLRKARELAVATAQRRQRLDVEELEDIRERRVDRREARQLALDQFALQAGIARRQGIFQDAQLRMIGDVAGRIEDRAGAQAERQERNQERLYAEMRAVYDRGERRAGERERMMVELVDRFAARGGRIDEGRLIALDERVRMVERSQTPQAQRDAARRRGEATAGRGHVSEVTDTSSASEIELQTPRTRRKRRARKAAGRGSAPRVRSSSDEEAQFRGAMSRAVHQADVSTDVAGGDTPPAPQPEPQPEPAQTQRSPQARSPSQEIATQTEPAQTARRIVSARKLTPREVDARARAIAEQAREEIRAAEEDLAQDDPQPSPKRPVAGGGSYAEFQREAAKHGQVPFKAPQGTPRERRAEEKHYKRQPSPAQRSPERDPEAEVVEQAVERLESPGSPAAEYAAQAVGAVARATGGVAMGVGEAVVEAMPSAQDVGSAAGRGAIGVMGVAARAVKGVAQAGTEAVVGFVSPEPEQVVGQQTGAPLVPRAAGEEPLVDVLSPFEQLIALRKPKQSVLFKESKKGQKKPDHPVNLGTETYESGKKFVITDVGGKIKSGAEGRRYVVYGMGGAGAKGAKGKGISFATHPEGEPLAEGEREFGTIQERALWGHLESGDLELDVSEGE